MRKPRIFWTYYPKSQRGYWRVSALPDPPTMAERKLWDGAHDWANAANRKETLRLAAQSYSGHAESLGWLKRLLISAARGTPTHIIVRDGLAYIKAREALLGVSEKQKEATQ